MFKHNPELEGTLTAHDFLPEDIVHLVTEDMEVSCRFKNAFYNKEDRYTVVYTEHSGYFVFLSEDIVFIYGRNYSSEE